MKIVFRLMCPFAPVVVAAAALISGFGQMTAVLAAPPPATSGLLDHKLLDDPEEQIEPSRPDEPFRDQFSMDAAVRFLDAVALGWQKDHRCFACHSDYAFLSTRPVVSWNVPVHEQLRSKLEHQAENPRKTKHHVTETVMTASVLAQNEALTTGNSATLQRYPTELADEVGRHHAVGRLAARFLGRPAVLAPVLRWGPRSPRAMGAVLRIATNQLRTDHIGGAERAYRWASLASRFAPSW